MIEVDAAIVGAGPTGLMLAGELARNGIGTLLLERRAQPPDVAKAGGLSGQIVQLFHYRGELDRFRAAGPGGPDPAPRFPFGGLQLDFTRIENTPMSALVLPQPQLEAVLADRAVEHGADIRRGHEVTDLDQTADAAIIAVTGPTGPYTVNARYVVACDGGRSRVRQLAGISFPGDSLPEIERLASLSVPETLTVLADGSLMIRGAERIPFGYTATAHGVFACAGTADSVSVYTAEIEARDYDDDTPMTVAELQASIRRVLDVDLPLGEPRRMTRFGYCAKQADAYRDRRVFLAGDAAHLFPVGGVAVNAGMLDAATLAWKLTAVIRSWGPPDLLDTYTDERRAAAERTLLHARAQVTLRRGHGADADALRTLLSELTTDEQPLRHLGSLMAGTDNGIATSPTHPLIGSYLTDHVLRTGHRDPRFAGLLHGDRPLLLDLADRPDVKFVAHQQGHRVNYAHVRVDNRPADALLIRPDTIIAWAAAINTASDTAARGLQMALDAGCPAPKARVRTRPFSH